MMCLINCAYLQPRAESRYLSAIIFGLLPAHKALTLETHALSLVHIDDVSYQCREADQESLPQTEGGSTQSSFHKEMCGDQSSSALR